MRPVVERSGLAAGRRGHGSRQSVSDFQHGKVTLMNWDMVVPTLLYAVLIAIGLITYIIVGLGHH
jgi:hypothetical protein